MGDVIRIDSRRKASNKALNPLPPGAVEPLSHGAVEPLSHGAVEPLWREAVGEHLRQHRRRRGDTLAGTAGRAGISPQYLSELERGHKDPSSEILAAVAGALGTSIAEIAGLVHRDLTHGGATMMAA